MSDISETRVLNLGTGLPKTIITCRPSIPKTLFIVLVCLVSVGLFSLSAVMAHKKLQTINEGKDLVQGIQESMNAASKNSSDAAVQNSLDKYGDAKEAFDFTVKWIKWEFGISVTMTILLSFVCIMMIWPFVFGKK